MNKKRTTAFIATGAIFLLILAVFFGPNIGWVNKYKKITCTTPYTDAYTKEEEILQQGAGAHINIFGVDTNGAMPRAYEECNKYLNQQVKEKQAEANKKIEAERRRKAEEERRRREAEARRKAEERRNRDAYIRMRDAMSGPTLSVGDTVYTCKKRTWFNAPTEWLSCRATITQILGDKFRIEFNESCRRTDIRVGQTMIVDRNSFVLPSDTYVTSGFLGSSRKCKESLFK